MRLASSLVPTLGLRASVADPDLKLRMRMAGFDTNAAVEIFVVSRLLLPIILFVVVWLYGRLIIGDGNGAIILLVASIAGIAGYLLPFLYLKNRIEKRRKAIQRAWPDALDLLVLTVEAGLPLDAALSRVASEIGKAAPILAHELKITIAEMLILPVRREAYENFASRTDLVMIRRVIDALIQVEEYGGEISSTLRVQARETRQLRISAAEQRAAALPPLLTVPMVVFLMPSLFAIILAPSLISVFGGE
ncbi:type II secretion system F family protein [Lutimaribacter sp. EGI FJ00013]|uniref:Type II secretion system F family protein n=1 Tax=Lutimaribacter degradans TaxID=2945989 RepID=A0ACC5ZZK9_9RHOB|nr:type II secretion system F family protein [Lutimaribacter sp. EGI FJ00013]MCM2563358.1 type II secretion system F family protein [Lutimaribacter sp. EGI FJ00013]